MDLKYIVYITVNMINNKLYVGVHKTNPNVFDGYIGCGIYRQSQAVKNIPFHKAVKKYGYENFKRTTIQIFENSEEGKKQAFDLERQIVTTTFIKSKNVYNCSIGGNVTTIETKRIYQYALNGNYLRSFKSINDAGIHLNVDNLESAIKAIRNNCLKKTNSAFGYFWSYVKKFEYNKPKNISAVSQYTVNGKFLRTFDSISEAEQAFGISNIVQSINNHYLSGGYQWRYYNGSSDDIEPLVNLMTKNKILPIKMIDKNGQVTIYSNIKACVDANPGLSASQINRVLKKIIKTHKGCSFTYNVIQDKDIV